MLGLKTLSGKLVFFVTLLVVATLITSFLFLGMILSDVIEKQIGKRALGVSETVSMLPEVRHALEYGDPDRKLETFVERIRKKVGAEFIVIGDVNSIRLTHPDTEKIGKKMVGGDNDNALLHGNYYVSKATGTLGPSIRGKSPVFDSSGEVIGIVSVGFLQDTVKRVFSGYLSRFLTYIYVAIIFSIVFAVLLSRKIKSSLLGREPRELSRLFLEKDAIINSVREAIVASDRNGDIRLFNKVAADYFQIDDESPDCPENLYRELNNCIQKETALSDISINIDGVEYVCNISPVSGVKDVFGAVATCRKKEEIDLLIWELSRVKQYSERLREKKHEFSNLLHLISGYIQIGEFDKAASVISNIQASDLDIINSFTDRIQDPTTASIFIGKFYFALDKGVSLRLEEDSEIGGIIPQKITSQLLTVLGNIVNNAIDAAASSVKRYVSIFATDIGKDYVFVIEDSGGGIDSSVLDEIFEKGYTTKDRTHSGYGLFFVKNALEQLGGSISVEQGEDGAVVSIYIPKGEADD